MTPLDQKTIKEHLINNSHLPIDVLKETDSTNTYLLKKIAAQTTPSICLAEKQTAGKGRLDRRWHSPSGENIYLSIHYPLQTSMNHLSGLSLVISLAVKAAISEACNTNNEILVKWPNDLLVDHKKLSGILIELQPGADGWVHAIIGIGINVNMSEANQKDISQDWTSLQRMTGKHHDRNQLSAALINHVLRYIETFSLHSFNHFIDEWNNADYLKGKPLQLSANHQIIKGTGAGISSEGLLQIQLDNGELRTFSSGEAQLLKSKAPH